MTNLEELYKLMQEASPLDAGSTYCSIELKPEFVVLQWRLFDRDKKEHYSYNQAVDYREAEYFKGSVLSLICERIKRKLENDLVSAREPY